MTQEEKSLLFKDLCARLSYGVKVKVEEERGYEIRTLKGFSYGCFSTEECQYEVDEIVPYLRPMYKMNGTEREECQLIVKDALAFLNTNIDVSYWHPAISTSINFELTSKVTDWLNAHHFDYRGLLEKGLALEASEGMYSYNK